MAMLRWFEQAEEQLNRFLKNGVRKYKLFLMQMLSIISMVLRGGEIMVDGYVMLIIAGRRTFAQVPARYQTAVHLDLLALGLDDDGNVLVTP
jgi:hypothetical protein